MSKITATKIKLIAVGIMAVLLLIAFYESWLRPENEPSDTGGFVEDDYVRPLPSELQNNAALYQKFIETTNLEDKAYFSIFLAGSDNAEAVPAIMRAITNDYRMAKLSMGDVHGLSGMITPLGFAAVKDEFAYQFLKNGMERDFWKKNRVWASVDDADEDVAISYLVGGCILGIGVSGRPEVDDILKTLRSKDKVFIRNFGDSVMEAAYYNDCNHAEPGSVFTAYTNGGLNKFNQWKRTKNGKRWESWYQSAQRK